MTAFNPSNDADLLLATNDEVQRAIENASREELQRPPAPGEWSAAEILGHMAEMEPYWARAAAAIAEQPGITIGRESNAPVRLAGPAGGAGLTPEQAVNLLTAAGNEAADIVREIPSGAAQLAGREANGGEVTVAQLVEQFILAHAREHAGQIRAALESARG